MKKFILKKRSILFHIVVTYFTYGIWALLYFSFKIFSSNNTNNITDTVDTNSIELNDESNTHDDYQYNNSFSDVNYDKIDKIEKKYRTIIDKHYKYIEQIGIAYTVANNLSLPDSPQMQKVIELCIQDIELAPTFSEYCKEMAKLYNQNEYIVNYPSFQRLAIIYEKQKEYQKAIDICKLAIELGFYKDGTTGQIPGRLARLIKKANKENIQIQN